MYTYVQCCTDVTVLWQGPPLCRACHSSYRLHSWLVICTALCHHVSSIENDITWIFTVLTSPGTGMLLLSPSSHHHCCCILQGDENEGEEGRVGVGVEVASDMALCWHCIWVVGVTLASEPCLNWVQVVEITSASHPCPHCLVCHHHLSASAHCKQMGGERGRAWGHCPLYLILVMAVPPHPSHHCHLWDTCLAEALSSDGGITVTVHLCPHVVSK